MLIFLFRLFWFLDILNMNILLFFSICSFSFYKANKIRFYCNKGFSFMWKWLYQLLWFVRMNFFDSQRATSKPQPWLVMNWTWRLDLAATLNPQPWLMINRTWIFNCTPSSTAWACCSSSSTWPQLWNLNHGWWWAAGLESWTWPPSSATCLCCSSGTTCSQLAANVKMAIPSQPRVLNCSLLEHALNGTLSSGSD